MPSLLSPDLEKTLQEDKKRLEATELPIVTVSASYREDLKEMFGLPANDTTPDVVFSRAHFSMAVGIAAQVWGSQVHPEKAWMVDPTNYVSKKQWFGIELTEVIGKTLARQPLLKQLKDLVDKFGRKKLPILKSITPPLLYLTQNIEKPILSFHIAAGNILAAQGKQITQVITDPHVREEYLDHAHLPTVKFCVFDEKTKTEFLEKAEILGIEADPARVIVTGPPIDPRVIKAKHRKQPWRSGPLKLCLTTGGLGTNKHELKIILMQLLPELRRRPAPYQLLVYAGTHTDHVKMIKELAAHEHITVGNPTDSSAKLRILYHPQIMDANELLIKYAFPWAHGFISKPSGDMAYDAAASGSFLLTLQEWGEWEHNIREIFEQKEIARKADVEHIVPQLTALTESKNIAQSWVERAMNKAISLNDIFLHGAEEIVKVALGKK